MKKSIEEMEVEQILQEIKNATTNDAKDAEPEKNINVSLEENLEEEKAADSTNSCDEKSTDEKLQTKEDKKATKKKTKKSVIVKFDLRNKSLTKFKIVDLTLSKSKSPSTVRVELHFKSSDKNNHIIILNNIIIWNLALYLKTVSSPKNVKYNNDNINLNNSFTDKDEVCSFCSERGKIILKVTDIEGNKTKIFLCRQCFRNFQNAILKANGYLNGELILNKYDKINSKHQNLITQFNAISSKNKNYKEQLKKVDELKNSSSENFNEYLLKENSALYLKVEELQKELAVYNRIFEKLNKFKNDVDKIAEFSSVLKKVFKDVIK